MASDAMASIQDLIAAIRFMKIQEGLNVTAATGQSDTTIQVFTVDSDRDQLEISD